ncbi:hypothetical protein CC85DRAFT_288952 [Cutaneotrichosporon oleaginosum]|uniref:tRNA ligase n=1 Tax=Cutaneotrichosporon oleaginosum TaxID=879819 RepID=A0A0J0XD80_9TREE|nr:uncharacterized protein CC85DRAFT_288952 [Cutaneotrichosporon oleaginosum]KLT39031.1 hypothetical protein CC85DRAFT_288952 [Cutaneotrichosporon oleaginosum]TXT03958.1 hypothetical protein COLE_07655 [Cutaneotrichosporon oleaginosum]
MPSSSQFPALVPDLLTALRALRVANPKATRSTVHIYPATLFAKNAATAKDRQITSWKMTEHMYFKKDNEFPTLARGLFTEVVNGKAQVPPAALPTFGPGPVKERIVARGYDKFFNTGEMAWTSWEAIEKHSEPPYHLTLKSNGCLILISALSPTELLVASKHSLGTTTETSLRDVETQLNNVKLDTPSEAATPAEPSSKAHAEVGREWVARTLQRSGKTTDELAKRLWDENLTAVLELCDDSFEEHVIATPEYWTGLHLHGLNYNTPLFATKSPDDVAAFAEEFGFIPTKHITLTSVPEVKAFTDEVAKSGSWEGEMIEGFVVRATVKDTPKTASSPPYLPGAPFFFKVKFEEPYLLYRQFRETTRAMLPLLDKISPEKEADLWKKIRSRTRRPEVGVYAEWCGRKMKEAPGLFKNYERGVVRVREVFLKWIEGEGKAAWESAKNGTWKAQSAIAAETAKAVKDASRAGLPKKWILVPVAVPGCGKTTVGTALADLFGFAHTQSDDIVSKKSTAGKFKQNIVELLKTHNVVYADRNNHIDKHYTELAGLPDEKQFAKALKPYDVRLVAIVWDIDAQPYHRLLRLCSERVVKRGDNHQTLRPDRTVDAEHEAVVANFLHNFTTPDASLFDKQIVIGIEDDQRTSLGKAVDGVVEVLGLKRPSEEEIDAALAAAQAYKVTTPFHGMTRMGKPVRYFGLAPEIDIDEVVGDALRSPMPAAAAESATAFIKSLREKQRITARPHITLSHEKNVKAEQDAAGEGAAPGPHAKAWATCKTLAEKGIAPIYEFDVTHLAWDDRVMALVVSNIRPQGETEKERDDQREAGLELVLPEEVQMNLHVTVGTQSETISAFESRSVVRAAREAIARGQGTGEGGEAVEGGGAVHWVAVGPLSGTGRIRGMY